MLGVNGDRSLGLAAALAALCLCGCGGGHGGPGPRGAPGPHGGLPPMPPEEAFTACRDKQVTDSCSVKPKDDGAQETKGTCEKGEGDKLFCRPQGGPDRAPPGDGLAPEALPR